MPEDKSQAGKAETPSGQPQTAKNEADALKAKLSEYENDLKRLQAEFENYKKRTERERGELLLRGRLEGTGEFLSLADELDEAAKHAKSSSPEQLAKGVSLLQSKCAKILRTNKIEEIASEGVADPLLHEVLLMQEGGEEGKIASVLRKGYKCGNYVLRHAQVAVFSGAKKEQRTGEKNEERTEEKITKKSEETNEEKSG